MFLGIGKRNKRVMSVNKICLYGIGFAGIDGSIGQLQHSCSGIEVIKFLCIQFITSWFFNTWYVGAEAFKSFGSGISRSFRIDLAAFLLDIAHQGIEDIEHTAGVKGVAIAGVEPAYMEDDPWSVRIDFMTEGLDLLGGNAGFLFGPLRCVRLKEIL